MEELTKTEERMMQVFWEKKTAFIKDIMADLHEEPYPAYSTVSSVARILERKGYLGFKAYGKTYEYFPIISKADYTRQSFKKLLANYFDGSPQSLLSYMVQEEDLSGNDIIELQKFIDKQ